jgi:hypothetical protein
VANPSTLLGPASSTVGGLNRGGSRSSRICDQIQTSIVTRGASQKHKALMLWSLPYTAKICGGGASADLPDGSIWAGVERVLVASSGLGRLALELPAARVSGWLPNEAPAGQGSVAAWLERGEQHLH